MEKRQGEEALWARLRARRRWTADDARWAVAAWAASGDTLVAFGEGHGVHPERLRRWRERLGTAPTRVDAGVPVGRGTAAPVTLVPVAVRSAGRPLAVEDEGAVVVSAGQVRIAIRDLSATSPEWVARLVGRLAAEVAS